MFRALPSTSRSFDDFQEAFLGNTCDLSDAERKGFFLTMKDFVHNHFQCEMDDDEVGGFYRFCLVHFKRNLARAANIWNLVPMEKVAEFKERALGLFDIPIGCHDRFHETVETLMDDFPRTWKWMNWYLQKDRCKILFPCLW